MTNDNTSVLVAGGGLVGLSAALFLAWRGVPAVLVERHPGSSPHPRAIGFTPRTMELLRAVGLGPRIPPAPGVKPRRIRVESLAGPWHEELPWTAGGREMTPAEYSPCRGAGLAQDGLEPILREEAATLGADIRLSTELLGFEQDADGVTATLRAADGSISTLRANYLIAADGHRSPIREALGIGRTGRGHIRTARSVLFRADLEEYLRPGFAQFVIDQPGLDAFLTTYGDGRWALFFSDDQERDEATLRAAVHQAIGRWDLPTEIIASGRWEVSALIADTFVSGRVFLAGDAAHTLPPSRGGFGANTGIEDAHNLAWKLEMVLAGEASPSLLDTYDAERRPIAWLRHQQIFARDDFKAMANGVAASVPIIDDAAMEFGQLYRSAAVLGAGGELPPALRPEEWAGQPGTRAPHLWVCKGTGRDGDRISTLDVFQRHWVLLAEDERWEPVASQASARLGITLDAPRIGYDVLSPDARAFQAAFGLGPTGASLIRPDGYVAWRATDLPANPAQALTEALGQVMGYRSSRQVGEKSRQSSVVSRRPTANSQ